MKSKEIRKGSVLFGLGLLISALLGGGPVFDKGGKKITGPSETKEASSFDKIYYEILKPNCGNSACHGVVFEPNFNSVESAYATMVYHPVIKNNDKEEFRYRVVPFDTAHSVLHERITNCCFVNNNDRMPQSKIGSKLPDEDIRAIETWIMDGAKDIFGNVPKEPNAEPRVTGMWVWNKSERTEYSNKDNRKEKMPFRTMLVPEGEKLWLCALLEDDNTAQKDLKNCNFMLSYAQDDFSMAKSFSATNRTVGNVELWAAEVDTRGMEAGKPIFFRVKVNDGNHEEDTVFPSNGTENSIKRTWSFQLGAIK